MRALAAVLLAATLVIAGRPVIARAGTQSEIAAMLAESARAWNRGQLERFMEAYEKSPATEYVGSKAVVRGYAAIRARYASHYGKTGMGTLSFSDLAVRPLGRDYAVAVARWHLALANGTHPAGIFSLVVHRSATGWHIVVDHTP